MVESLRSKKGQSIVEYSTIIIVVMLGIIVMGPYVIRSVNANLKMWEDAVNDSVSDEPVEADVSEIPPPPEFSPPAGF